MVSSVEIRRGRAKRELPLGNVWERRPENANPGLKSGNRFNDNEYKDLSQASETVRRVSEGIQAEFIRKGWGFASAVGNDNWFAIVFANPLRSTTTQKMSFS